MTTPGHSPRVPCVRAAVERPVAGEAPVHFFCSKCGRSPGHAAPSGHVRAAQACRASRGYADMDRRVSELHHLVNW